MDIIESFIKKYEKERTVYEELARKVSKILEDKLIETGIRAIVTSRAKRVDRLKTKLKNRNKDGKYKTIDDILEDIVDLSGVRIALYFPEDRIKVEEIIKKEFDCLKQKSFPEKEEKPTYEKRFSGYWANHYRIKLKNEQKNNKNDKYYTKIVEIQVASILMHAWSEVEHDLAYKPLNGRLSEEEYLILDELNGLVMAGEIALKRLQKAGENRTKKNKIINNHYDLSTFINNYKPNYKDYGNIKLLYDYLKIENNNNLNYLKNKIENISNEKQISDEFLKADTFGNKEKYVKLYEIQKNKSISNVVDKYLDNLSKIENNIKSATLKVPEIIINKTVKVPYININKTIKKTYDKDHFNLPIYDISKNLDISPNDISKLFSIKEKILFNNETVKTDVIKEINKKLKDKLDD